MKHTGLSTAFYALLGTGALLGTTTNLAKVAASMNIAALPFLMWSLMGAAIFLLSLQLFKGQSIPVNREVIKYSVFSSLLTVAGSNLILFSAIAHVGVSFVALAISLPPLLTYVFALFLGMEKACLLRSVGVILSLAGTMVLVAAKWQAPQASHTWLLLTLLGPVLLAAGNIYRTAYWPKGISPESLVPSMLVAATLILAAVGGLVPSLQVSLPISGSTLALLAVQSLVFSGQFVLLFVLQKAGGPVFLSLTGPVAALLGIPVAVVLLNERLVPAILPSAVLIATGVGFMVLQQLKIQRLENRERASEQLAD
ncbi:DMT family transporter [Pseudoalteromonas rubra]|uniref:EamA domain-containing protein n=1 Tax=Pseudoalteromonas rubra TaxID=43658 RepID=A0A0U2P929_9GAMM|nr:DMT family transporter [Pseudoalteromonas rubra]ALU43565.1 hypothetical protein AT705_11765 [Pseudoalteromonas rubra]